MASNYIAKGLKRSALSVALGLCFIGGVQAQSTTGSIYGDAGAGATVTVQNQSGFTRTVIADAAGRYSIGSLPTGEYTVTIQRDGQVVGTRNVTVLAGAGADAGATTLDTVTVTASALNTIDVSTVESKLIVTKEMLEKVPIAPNLTSISLLAPGVVQGDSRYGNVPAFMGSSASENAYYINGFPVTQSLTQFGYTELPFNAVDQVQVSTGGYPVEYGRATGGVVSVITSSGTNDWKFGGQYIYRPASLRSDPRNLHYGPNGRSGLPWSNAGQLRVYNKDNTFERKTLSAYASGPILRDRLFFFAAGEFVETDVSGVTAIASSATAVNNARRNGWTDSEINTPRWLGRIDWNITDNHLLNVTAIQDRTTEHDDRSGFDYATLARVGSVVSGYDRDRNTRAYIGNYTGYITDNLTVTAMYGESKTEYEGSPVGYDPNCPTIVVGGDAQVPGLTYTPGCQLSASPGYLPGRFDKTEAWRLDVEYRLGDSHTLKAGYDSNEASSLVGSTNDGIAYPGALGFAFAGGYQWSYLKAADPNEPLYQPQGVRSPASGGGYGLQGYYVVRNVGNNISSPRAVQRAQYIKDIWQVTDNVLLEIGLRNEQFYNYASDGSSYLTKDRQLAPRVGVTWDVSGDSSTKLYASAGRYHLAVPNNVARRGVDGAENTSEAFTYTGVDPTTGAPTGLTSLGPVWSPNNEFGQPRDGKSFSPTSLKSHYQDTFAMGAEHNFGSFNAGAKFTYASLGSAIDDFCDGRPVWAWGQTKGYSREELGFVWDEEAEVWVPDHGVAGFFAHCVLINPGEDNTYQYDVDGNGTYDEVTLTKEMLGFPKMKRKYKSVDLFVERPFDGKWYGRLDYTWSKSIGNIEGQLNSDIGQIDVSTTLTGDYYELALNAYGYLPNDRRHQLKANGFYQFTPEFTVSGAMSYASGRPMNCRGAVPNIDPESPNYGSFHFFCNGVAVPRGTFGRLPATLKFDLGARYQPNWMKGLSLGVNVFNVFDRQSVANVAELRYAGTSDTTISADWNRVQSYTAPRYVEFTIRYDWNSKK